jgi:hypothetical protein
MQQDKDAFFFCSIGEGVSAGFLDFPKNFWATGFPSFLVVFFLFCKPYAIVFCLPYTDFEG